MALIDTSKNANMKRSSSYTSKYMYFLVCTKTTERWRRGGKGGTGCFKRLRPGSRFQNQRFFDKKKLGGFFPIPPCWAGKQVKKSINPNWAHPPNQPTNQPAKKTQAKRENEETKTVRKHVSNSIVFWGGRFFFRGWVWVGTKQRLRCCCCVIHTHSHFFFSTNTLLVLFFIFFYQRRIACHPSCIIHVAKLKTHNNNKKSSKTAKRDRRVVRVSDPRATPREKKSLPKKNGPPYRSVGFGPWIDCYLPPRLPWGYIYIYIFFLRVLR